MNFKVSLIDNTSEISGILIFIHAGSFIVMLVSGGVQLWIANMCITSTEKLTCLNPKRLEVYNSSDVLETLFALGPLFQVAKLPMFVYSGLWWMSFNVFQYTQKSNTLQETNISHFWKRILTLVFFSQPGFFSTLPTCWRYIPNPLCFVLNPHHLVQNFHLGGPIPGLGYVVNKHGDRCCPLRIRLWDPFQMAFFGWS